MLGTTTYCLLSNVFHKDEKMSKVAVIGLGQMGATLARLLMRNGDEVHVWNRTSSKAAALASDGAIVAASAGAAIRAAEVILVCVHDYDASNAIFEDAEVRSSVSGKVLVQLTTGSPQEARDAAVWAREHRVGYVDGAIQVAPEQMGKPDTTILVSGSLSDFQTAQSALAACGGNVVYLGESISAAATMDLATLSYVYGAIIGFFQGALLCESEELDLDIYGSIVQAMSPSYGEFLKHQAGVIRSGNFAVSQSPLSISVDATRRIEQISRARGLNTELPALVSNLFKQAADAALGHEEIAALIKVMRTH